MDNIDKVYSVLASSTAALSSALLIIFILTYLGAHRNSDGAISRRRLASVFVLSASAYTFFVLATGELIFGISIEHMISDGFGGERLAWLLLLIFTDLIFRLWDEFRR